MLGRVVLVILAHEESLAKVVPKTLDFISLHKDPQKYIGTWTPWGTVSVTLFHGMYVDPENAMVLSPGNHK